MSLSDARLNSSDVQAVCAGCVGLAFMPYLPCNDLLSPDCSILDSHRVKATWVCGQISSTTLGAGITFELSVVKRQK